MNSLPKTVTRQRRGCDLNPGPSAPESSTITTRVPGEGANVFSNVATDRLLNAHPMRDRFSVRNSMRQNSIFRRRESRMPARNRL